MSTFGEASYPVGKKDYRCEWCGEAIPKGEKHVNFVGTWEGEFQNWRAHYECYAAAGDNDALTDGFMPYENERPTAEVPS